jgi:hypothetical protein
MEVITVIATVASAVATVAIALLTFETIKAYRQQVQIGQAQVEKTQAQTYSQQRPVLVPPDIKGSNLLTNNPGMMDIQWGQGQVTIDGLQNIGLGPAFNIYGIFFGRPFQGQPPHTQRYSVWNYGVLAPGAAGQDMVLSQGTNVKSETTIQGHTLYVPDDANHNGDIVRFTITYRDIFRRRLASIYDYQSVLGWMCVGNFEDIDLDLYELDQLDPMTQQSNKMFHAMSKMKP